MQQNGNKCLKAEEEYNRALCMGQRIVWQDMRRFKRNKRLTDERNRTFLL